MTLYFNGKTLSSCRKVQHYSSHNGRYWESSTNLSIYLLFITSQGSSGDERAMAKEVSSFIGRGSSEEIMAEGQEPNEFWEILGGKTSYASDRRYTEQRIPIYLC